MNNWAWPHTVAEAFQWVPARLLFLLLVAVVARWILLKMISASVSKMVSGNAAARGLGALVASRRREQRITALGGLLRAVVTAIIVFIVAVTALSELGFNITSIIAGSSVVGVAIAFGLQTIFKDLLSGVFMLVEDQLGVGDYVDMDKASGTVENVGLRVTTLRDGNKNVWYVRNGEVLRVGNFSQGGTDGPPETPPATWVLGYAAGKPTTTAADTEITPQQPQPVSVAGQDDGADTGTMGAPSTNGQVANTQTTNSQSTNTQNNGSGATTATRTPTTAAHRGGSGSSPAGGTGPRFARWRMRR